MLTNTRSVIPYIGYRQFIHHQYFECLQPKAVKLSVTDLTKDSRSSYGRFIRRVRWSTVTDPSGALRMLYALKRFEHVTEQNRRDLAKFWTRSLLPQNSHVKLGGSIGPGCSSGTGASGMLGIGAITIGVPKIITSRRISILTHL